MVTELSLASLCVQLVLYVFFSPSPIFMESFQNCFKYYDIFLFKC